MHRLAPQVLFRKRREYIPVGSHKNIHVFERCEKNFRRKPVRWCRLNVRIQMKQGGIR
jgi:hypothetical protein